MYINFKKMIKILGLILSAAVLVFGIFSYIISLSAQQQTVGVLTSIFGLQLAWFVSWVTEEKK